MALETSEPLRARVAELQHQVAALVARVTALEARAPRDAADQTLGEELAAKTDAEPFRCHELLDHAALFPSLAAALADVGIQSAGELGCWLRNRVGTRYGVTITRLSGRRWRVSVE